ncbi:hypothetical protein lerEdw1_006720 [Lerista edwardsae]|nr:hypothetical protein lerEdw1_006720 [Lerista edwardsae]
MFLMKSPPLVALQRKWEPFSPSRSCRYPICFSESEDDLARTAVSAKVQMIISNLQSDESSLGAGGKYGCLAQKKRKGAKVRGGGQALQEHLAFVQRHCPADSDGMEVEESAEFGPLSLNSDSDDSVDRDIEEAIQEYLRNKSRDAQCLPSSAKSLHSVDRGKRLQEDYPSWNAACKIFPAKAEVVHRHLAPGYLGDEAVREAPSPCSTSSDDSFEQSIQAEIEQFLNEKRRRERTTQPAGEGKRLDQKVAPETLALRNQKESAECLNRSSVRRGGKPLFPRQLSEPQSGPAPPKRLQPGSLEEPADFRRASQACSGWVAGHSCVPPRNGEGQIGPKLREARQGQSAEASDSSSDDGIEEAIRLYQLEKVKREAGSRTGCPALWKEAWQAEGVADVATSLKIRSAESALPATPRRARGRRLTWQATGPSRLGAACGELEKGRRRAPAANRFASRTVAFQASSRVDTAAELMCAEAILDISKAILPPPCGGSEPRTLAEAPGAPPSRQESDSNAVDSDDSIEKEIRAFLAVKAQAGRLTAKSDGSRRAVRSPSSSRQPGDQGRSPKRSACRTWQRSLSRRKRLRRESQGPQQIQDKPEALSEAGRSPEDCSKPLASPRPDIPKAGETAEAGGCPQDALAASSSVGFARPPPQGRRGHSKTATRAPQKYGAGDESSSLDSDEDLDTAIKDLLRSKRRLRKKPKDQRVPGKKKVRFGDAETLVFEDKLGGSQDRRSRAGPLPKSCLAQPQRDDGEEESKSRPPTVVRRTPQSAKAAPLALECKKEGPPKSGPDTGKTTPSRWAAPSLVDDSSSVDSDDSIEQEIRKFLAEKAKDAASGAEADRTVRPPGAAKPQTAPLKAKRRLLWAEDSAPPKRRRKVEKVGPPAAELRCALKAPGNSPRTVALVEDASTLPPGKLQTNPGVVQAEGTDSPARSPAGDHQAVPQLAQRSLPPGKGGATDRKLRNYAKPLKRKNLHEFKLSSKFIAGLKSAHNKKTAVAVGKRHLGVSVLEREGVISAASVLSRRRDPALQRGVPGSRGEAGLSEADLPTADQLQPSAPERLRKRQASPLCEEALGLVARSSAGVLEPPSGTAASQGPNLQAPNIGDLGEAKVSAEPLHLEVPGEEEEGPTHGHSASGEERSLPSTPRCLPLKENALASPDRLAGRRAQDVLEGGSAEFIDGPVAEQPPCKPSSL